MQAQQQKTGYDRRSGELDQPGDDLLHGHVFTAPHRVRRDARAGAHDVRDAGGVRDGLAVHLRHLQHLFGDDRLQDLFPAAGG